MDQKVSLKGNFTKYIALNKTESRTYQNVCCIAKTMLSGRCRTVNACVRKEGTFQISNLASLLNNLDKQE